MLEARYVEATQHEDGSVGYKRPFYALAELVAPSEVALLYRLGYRYVKRDISMRRYYYARPWPLWAALRLSQKISRTFWGVLLILYQWGLIHKVTSPAQRTRFRDLRLGPGPKYGY